jgi:hypothetical protein
VVVDSSKKISLPTKLPTPHPLLTSRFNLPSFYLYTPHTEPELSTPQEQPKSACQLNYSFNQIRLLVFEVLEDEDGRVASCASHTVIYLCVMDSQRKSFQTWTFTQKVRGCNIKNKCFLSRYETAQGGKVRQKLYFQFKLFKQIMQQITLVFN